MGELHCHIGTSYRKGSVKLTENNAKAFKKAYVDANEVGAESFKFEDTVINTSYAKFLIEYLEKNFSNVFS